MICTINYLLCYVSINTNSQYCKLSVMSHEMKFHNHYDVVENIY